MQEWLHAFSRFSSTFRGISLRWCGGSVTHGPRQTPWSASGQSPTRASTRKAAHSPRGSESRPPGQAPTERRRRTRRAGWTHRLGACADGMSCSGKGQVDVLGESVCKRARRIPLLVSRSSPAWKNMGGKEDGALPPRRLGRAAAVPAAAAPGRGGSGVDGARRRDQPAGQARLGWRLDRPSPRSAARPSPFSSTRDPSSSCPPPRASG
jgi:hypothetical protein